MISLTLAARGFREQLQRCAAAGRQRRPPAAAAAAAAGGQAARAMAAVAEGGESLDAQKRRVREEVKAALRALSTEQMAAESEWWGRREDTGAGSSAACGVGREAAACLPAW